MACRSFTITSSSSVQLSKRELVELLLCDNVHIGFLLVLVWGNLSALCGIFMYAILCPNENLIEKSHHFARV